MTFIALHIQFCSVYRFSLIFIVWRYIRLFALDFIINMSDMPEYCTKRKLNFVMFDTLLFSPYFISLTLLLSLMFLYCNFHLTHYLLSLFSYPCLFCSVLKHKLFLWRYMLLFHSFDLLLQCQDVCRSHVFYWPTTFSPCEVHPLLSHDFSLIIIIIIIIINCNWVVTRWQWLFYMYKNMKLWNSAASAFLRPTVHWYFVTFADMFSINQ